MKILFLTSRFPFPPLGGDRLRVSQFLKALSKRHEITLLSLSETPVSDEQQRLAAPFVERCETVVLPRKKSFINCALGAFSSKPLQVHYYNSTSFRKKLNQLLQTQHFDAIFSHLLRMADYALNANGAAKILDLTDALGLNYERNRKLGKGLKMFDLAQRIEFGRVRSYEQKILPRFHQSLLISEADRDYMSTYAPSENVQIIGAGVDLEYFQFYDDGYDANQLVFVGKMSTTPNLDAAQYFIREILPIIERNIPQIKLDVVGIEPPRELLKLQKKDKISVTGEVEDVRPFLHKAAASLCPIRGGAGAKNKILESMAAGTPVVSTHIGLEGLDLLEGRHVLAADAPEVFAEHIISLVKSPEKRRKLALAGRQIVEQNFGWDRVLANLDAIIENAISARNRRDAMHRVSTK